MKILKASAGSGKTFNLSKTYLELLLGSQDPRQYRHVLAVTFTNKATAEMKSRILDDLHRRASDDPGAREVLLNLLHDYGAFAVSTIDRFFQQALKAFSREIGQFADYQIELDRKSLIREAMDRILDSLTEEDEDVIRWINANVSERLQQGEKLRIEDSLYRMGELLKSEEHRELAERCGVDDLEAFSKQRLASIRGICDRVIREFREAVAPYGIEAAPGEMIKFEGRKRLLKANPELAEIKDSRYAAYLTAFTLDKLVFSLGLAGEFYREFDALLKEKNVMSLDESNTILRDIINGSDAPFVYEKLGVRYEHFLLDEFQDTSNIQWENFLPLLRESESKGGGNLMVGDVKQSIYRFRNSDWKLLGGKVHEEFPDAEVETLKYNWRSCRAIVGFNNRFFEAAAAEFGLSDIYSDVVQTPRADDSQEGFVELTFCDDQLQAVYDSVCRALESGAAPGDIAVLVRGCQQGSDIASFLIGKGVPVISDDSLSVNSSLTVRRLVALLNAFENPEDTISGFIAESLDVKFPDSCHSLVDFCESLLRSLRDSRPESFEGETLFIQAFMDDLLSWTSVYGNNLRAWLRHWEESELQISSPEDASAVRVMTIHKAKGLEFPYVIFPFADKVTLYKPDVRWCRLDVGGSGLDPALNGIYPVKLSKENESGCFADAYAEERRLQLVDNMNIFYVALTRAVKTLHVISATPSKSLREGIAKGRPEYSRLSDFLFAFAGAADECSFGSPYDFRRMVRKSRSDVEDFAASYPSISLDERLSSSTEATDFFDEEGRAGVSPRINGIVLHEILSGVSGPDDVEAAVSAAAAAGKLDSAAARSACAMLRERVATHADWFPGRGAKVCSERSIIAADGSEHRPDRVVFTPEGVIIIDFKFGRELKSHLAQLRRYASLYSGLGFPVKAGVVWYVLEDKCVAI